VHVLQPPGRGLCRLTLGAAKQVALGIDPDGPEEQILVFAPWNQPKHIAALATNLFLPDEAERIIVR
jgi:hypothetical protein